MYVEMEPWGQNTNKIATGPGLRSSISWPLVREPKVMEICCFGSGMHQSSHSYSFKTFLRRSDKPIRQNGNASESKSADTQHQQDMTFLDLEKEFRRSKVIFTTPNVPTWLQREPTSMTTSFMRIPWTGPLKQLACFLACKGLAE